MNVSMLNIIMAHSGPGVAERIEDHMPFWKAHGARMILTSPYNSRVNIPSTDCVPIGLAEHHGQNSIRRFRETLACAARIGSEWTMVNEYDSFCSTPEISAQIMNTPGLWCNRFTNDKKDARFTAEFFCHPPLLMDKRSLFAILGASEVLEDYAQGGFWDRWIAKAADLSGVDVHGYCAAGFAMNTIEESNLPAAREAAKAGAVFWHGIKSRNAFEAATKPEMAS